MVPDDLNRRAALALLLGAGALAATGCGFALRKAPEFAFRSIYVDLPANSSIGNELRRQLQGTGKLEVIQDAARRDQAEVLLQSVLDVRDRIVVGRDASGQVREFQLRQRFRFRVRTPAGKEVLPMSEILRQIDQSYSESAALSKEAEAQMLFQNMQTDIVQQVMRRLATIKL